MNEKSTEQTYYDFVLETLGIEPSAVQQGNITITAPDGHGYLSSQSAYPSLVEPFHVSIPNLEALKALTGGIDLQTDLAQASSLKIPEPWPENKNTKRAAAKVTERENKKVRQALIATGFGYSDRVTTYKQIMELRFPMKAIAYPGESLTVRKGEILTIEPNGHDPVFVIYQTITLEEGGQIQCEAPVIMSAEKFVKTEAPLRASVPTIVKTKENSMPQKTEYERDMEKLAQYGLLSGGSQNGVLKTGDRKGPMILSTDPEKSHIEAFVITVNDIDELKELSGISNEQLESNDWERNFTYPPSYSAERLQNADPFAPDICQAFRAYIYGDARRVESYKGILNELRFPLQLTVFSAEDITVSPDHPLIIRDESGHGEPVVVVYNTVTVEPGGQIIWEATGKMTCNQMTFQESDEQNFISKGANGGKGGDGSAGSPGSPGTNGNPGQDNKNSCNRSATDGTAGGTGTSGGHGQEGGRGGDGNPVNMSVEVLNGTVNIGSGGGNGGNGGSGGDGGNGGKGGNGGSGTSNCKQAKGGNGGKAGNGGNAGKGGDGGDGKDVYVTYQSGNPNFVLKPATGSPGNPGTPGKAGTPGQGGSGNPAGSTGASGTGGAAASAGQTGKAGTIYINGKELG